MVRIAKMFDFDAAHFLPQVREGHKCARMHGHTYSVEVVAEGEPDERGMVVDYEELAAAWGPIHAVLDHRTLNDVPGLENPTTEILAPWILERFSTAIPEVVVVRVYESSSTWCEAEGVATERARAEKAEALVVEMLEALGDLAHPERRSDCNERKCGSCSTCRARAAIAKAEGPK